MSGITKQKYNKVQAMAMKIVTAYGVSKVDTMENKTARRAIYRGWAYQLVAEFGIAYQTARQHIAKACRRQRFPDWIPPDEWGGDRQGG